MCRGGLPEWERRAPYDSVFEVYIRQPESATSSPYPAQQESFVTSLWKAWAASFSPSTVVR